MGMVAIGGWVRASLVIGWPPSLVRPGGPVESTVDVRRLGGHEPRALSRTGRRLNPSGTAPYAGRAIPRGVTASRSTRLPCTTAIEGGGTRRGDTQMTTG